MAIKMIINIIYILKWVFNIFVFVHLCVRLDGMPRTQFEITGAIKIIIYRSTEMHGRIAKYGSIFLPCVPFY